MMDRKFIFAGLCALAVFSMTGCFGNNSTETAAVPAETSIRETITEADPQGAAEAIYATLEGSEYEKLDKEDLQELVGIESTSVVDFWFYYSNPSKGLADIAIILPRSNKVEEVRQTLFNYQEQRIKEFTDYDILGSLSIAQSAIVYDQGDYLILLMLKDNEAAQTIIDEYMPQ